MNPEILASTYAIFEDMTNTFMSLLKDNPSVAKAELHPALKAMDEARDNLWLTALNTCFAFSMVGLTLKLLS